MHQFLTFVAHHWVLVAIFILLLLILTIEEARNKGIMRRLSIADAVRLINDKNALVLDIRPQNQFVLGHIAGAINMQMAQLVTDHNILQKDPERPIIVACAQGNQAMKAIEKLTKQGVLHLHLLTGGMRAWSDQNMPLVKGAK